MVIQIFVLLCSIILTSSAMDEIYPYLETEIVGVVDVSAWPILSEQNSNTDIFSTFCLPSYMSHLQDIMKSILTRDPATWDRQQALMKLNACNDSIHCKLLRAIINNDSCCLIHEIKESKSFFQCRGRHLLTLLSIVSLPLLVKTRLELESSLRLISQFYEKSVGGQYFKRINLILTLITFCLENEEYLIEILSENAPELDPVLSEFVRRVKNLELNQIAQSNNDFTPLLFPAHTEDDYFQTESYNSLECPSRVALVDVTKLLDNLGTSSSPFDQLFRHLMHYTWQPFDLMCFLEYEILENQYYDTGFLMELLLLVNKKYTDDCNQPIDLHEILSNFAVYHNYVNRMVIHSIQREIRKKSWSAPTLSDFLDNCLMQQPAVEVVNFLQKLKELLQNS